MCQINVENRPSYQHYLIRSFKINAETTATLQRNLDTSERPALRKRLCENFKKNTTYKIGLNCYSSLKV